jgi:sporulation protein YlmC with PRC-barrel domain
LGGVGFNETDSQRIYIRRSAIVFVMFTSDLIDKEVVGAEGWRIGKVREILIDKDKWTVTGLSVALESNVAKEFNLKKLWGRSDVTIPIGQVQGAGDRIVLKSSKTQIFEIAKTEAEKQHPTQDSGEAPEH